jgi:Spy/CpxP family protein refolding chaperone
VGFDQRQEMDMTFFANTAAAPKARRIALATATAVALSLATTASIAQPGGGYLHGAHGGGGIEQMIPRVLERAKASLNLDTSQQAKWDSVVAQGKAAREAGRVNRQKVRDALTGQLATAEPDLAAVAAAADGVEQQNRALRTQVRDGWLALYATFSPEQKAVVRDLLQRKVARAESLRQRIRQHLQERFGPSGS